MAYNINDELSNAPNSDSVKILLLNTGSSPSLIMLFIRILAFAFGLWLVVFTLNSAVRTFVLPRSAQDKLTRFVFRRIRRIFDFRTRRVTTYEHRDAIMAMYAPMALMMLLPTWYLLVMVGYVLMFWATGVEPLKQAFILSGSSLYTLGFARDDELSRIVLTYTEATIGLLLVALLIAYLPTMYSAFSSREKQVNLLAVRAGDPPSAVEMILRFHRIQFFGDASGFISFLRQWEEWFAEVEESHTSLAALVFFRSPQPGQSWLTASGAVLDFAALMASTIDLPRSVQCGLTIRAGYLMLRRVSDFFRLPYNPDPLYPDEPISISREEFDEACEQLAADGIPLIADREQAWKDFAGWRVNYDRVLILLCALTMAPYAPWSSDRSSPEMRTALGR